MSEHFKENVVYILLAILIFAMMYFMSDCMYTKEVGLIILGYIGALIRGSGYAGNSVDVRKPGDKQ